MTLRIVLSTLRDHGLPLCALTSTRGEREPLCFALGKHACLESSHYPRYERDVGLFDEYPRNPASESRGDSVCSFNKINIGPR